MWMELTTLMQSTILMKFYFSNIFAIDKTLQLGNLVKTKTQFVLLEAFRSIVWFNNNFHPSWKSTNENNGFD
jgi:hypothetical protein